MDAIRDYLAMGGYAGFVWPAYAITLGAMIWLVVDSLRKLRADRKTLEALQQDSPHRRGKAGAGQEDDQDDS